MASFKPDRAKTMASQLASKGYYAGEASGFRFGRASGELASRLHVAECLFIGIVRLGWSGRPHQVYS